MTTYLLLDNIRSVHNVGSIFRTAETLGIAKIFCLDTTPTPLDRFGRKRSDFAKVSLGSENLLDWEHIENGTKLIKELKKDGFRIVALEQAENSVDYKKVAGMLEQENMVSKSNLRKINHSQKDPINLKKNEHKILIILGNEVDGVSKELLKLVDMIAEIPMKGKKESLNVSVSAGIFLYRLLDN